MRSIVFVSNFLSSHQEPFCEAMYDSEGVDFYFIAISPLSEGRRAMGWKQENAKPYEIRSYLNEEEKNKAISLIKECDVLLYGCNDLDFFDVRMKANKGITFRVSERIYKKGIWRALSPRGLKYRWNSYYKYDRKRLHLLCASSYAAMDYVLLGSYIGKHYKWGYFPPVKAYDIKELLQAKKNNQILWVGRMIELKHPETVIDLAERLKRESIDYEINMIGDGPEKAAILGAIKRKGLEKNVHLLGSMDASRVREYMEKAAILVASSDYYEGWGAVINEAMNSGCAVVATSSMGSVDFLIKDKVNGIKCRYKDTNTFYESVYKLLTDKGFREEIAQNAYNTIVSEWNAKVAAERLIHLSEQLLEGTGKSGFKTGPCSDARVFRKGD